MQQTAPDAPEGLDAHDAKEADAGETAPDDLQVRTDGRLCTGFAFSMTAPHSCTIYDKTKELLTSRKDWMKPIWWAGGWDGQSRVIRVEFRYDSHLSYWDRLT